MPFLHTVILNAISVRKYNILANEARVVVEYCISLYNISLH